MNTRCERRAEVPRPHSIHPSIQGLKAVMRTTIRALAIAGASTVAILAALHASALAEETGMHNAMPGMSTGQIPGMPAQPSGDGGPSSQAFAAANARMHAAMAIPYTGNADADFVRGMIPHHQGAIDMAKVVLQYGKDDQTKKWASDVIRDQQREISEMQEWLKKNAR